MHTLRWIPTLVLAGWCGTGSAIAAEHTTPTAPADLKKLQPAPGCKVELFAAEPLVQNPVAFSIDGRGRVFVAETHRWRDAIFDITQKPAWLLADLSFTNVPGRADFLRREFGTNGARLTNSSELIRLIEDRDGDGRADTASVWADGFNEVSSGVGAGVLARAGDLYYTCIPDLWRFPAGASTAKESSSASARPREKLASGFGVHIGVSGHDLHGLAAGPDGKIYFSSGDRGFAVTTREGRRLESPNTGGVLRCNPDGSELEVFCIGLRNPQELAFDDWGNLWTDDNDTAGPDDSRVLHLVEGADYGWRCSYQHQAGFGPWCQEKVWQGHLDDALPPAGMVAQGPSGLACVPGAGLPPQFRGRFLVCDFPGGVWSFGVRPRGASYEVTEREKLLWNLWPTDVDFGPDGTIYVADWVQGWTQPDQGRIYRLSFPGMAGDALGAATARYLSEGMEGRKPDALAALLGHPDRRVRLEAQWALARRAQVALGPLTTAARQHTNRLARIHAVWGMGQLITQGSWSGRPGCVRVLRPLLEDTDAEVRAQAASVMGQARVQQAVAALQRLLQDPEPRVRFHAAIALGRIADPCATVGVVEMLRANDDEDPYLRHAGVFALQHLAHESTLTGLRNDLSTAVRRAALLTLRRLQRREVASFLRDRDPHLVNEAARAINDVPIPSAAPALAALLDQASGLARLTGKAAPLPSAPSVPEPVQDRRFAANLNPGGGSEILTSTLRRAINACFRAGHEEDAQRLARFALGWEDGSDLRAEALDALGDWAKPPPLDRVMGLWRPLPSRDPAPARAALLEILPKLIPQGPERVRLAAVRCVGRLGIREAGSLLQKTYRQPGTPVAVRREILSALAANQDEQLDSVVALGLASPETTLRREAVRWAGQVRTPGTAALLDRLVGNETDVRLRQAAFETLGGLADPGAEEVLARWLDRLLAGQLAEELTLDVVEAARARPRPGQAITERLAKCEASGSTNSPVLEHAMLQGGDAARGRIIFEERAEVSCLRCHAAKGQGGTVGPALDGIGSKRSRVELLDSILFPNRSLAPGFESATLTLQNGTAYSGVVKGEDAEEIRLDSPEDGGLIRIRKTEVTSRRAGLSAMPEGSAQFLSKRELRDLVEYLASLK